MGFWTKVKQFNVSDWLPAQGKSYLKCDRLSMYGYDHQVFFLVVKIDTCAHTPCPLTLSHPICFPFFSIFSFYIFFYFITTASSPLLCFLLLLLFCCLIFYPLPSSLPVIPCCFSSSSYPPLWMQHWSPLLFYFHRVVLWFWFCNTQLHKHVAVFNRSSSRKPNDACKCTQVCMCTSLNCHIAMQVFLHSDRISACIYGIFLERLPQ